MLILKQQGDFSRWLSVVNKRTADVRRDISRLHDERNQAERECEEMTKFLREKDQHYAKDIRYLKERLGELKKRQQQLASATASMQLTNASSKPRRGSDPNGVRNAQLDESISP
jgi:phage host-nuclease inhibitor protein Gam